MYAEQQLGDGFWGPGEAASGTGVSVMMSSLHRTCYAYNSALHAFIYIPVGVW